MFARLLLLALVLVPSLVAAQPVTPEIYTKSFLVEIVWVNPSIDGSTYTLGLTDGSEIQVPSVRFQYSLENDPGPKEPARARALVTALVVTALPKEIDRVRRSWKMLRDFRFGRYRPERDAGRVHSDLTATVFVHDEIHQMDLESTWNPYWEKD